MLGTGIVRLPGLNCGRTGLSEAQAAGEGYDVMTALAVTDDKAHYYPGAATFITKLVADRQSRRLLGAQVFGPGSVDKMIDIAATGIAAGMKLDDFDSLDLAYAPPFSTAIHPLVQAVYVLLNKLSGAMVSMTPAEYAAGKAQGRRVIDVSRAPAVPGATYVALDKVQGPIDGIGTDEPLLLVCTKGRRAYLLQRKLAAFGYTDTVVLEGSTSFCEVKAHAAGTSVPPEEVARVKGLGFLRDKNTADRFNGRVITRNGKITAEESRAISEAAERFGSGEIAMTSRLTVEIQGVPFDSIEPMREFLMQAGLETGGTGSKVRPVVSCKGTTCQYGLIDTFSLSEEIHERFYHGYSHVKLPHKFKIAVGGCPNNCVKPDLNDLGIIGSGCRSLTSSFAAAARSVRLKRHARSRSQRWRTERLPSIRTRAITAGAVWTNAPSKFLSGAPTATASTSADAGAKKSRRAAASTGSLPIGRRFLMSLRRRSCSSASRELPENGSPTPSRASALKMCRSSCFRMNCLPASKIILLHKSISSAARPADSKKPPAFQPMVSACRKSSFRSLLPRGRMSAHNVHLIVKSEARLPLSHDPSGILIRKALDCQFETTGLSAGGFFCSEGS